MEYCYVVYWEEKCLKKICVDSQPVDQEFPDAELVPIAKVLCSVEWPVSIRGLSPSGIEVRCCCAFSVKVAVTPVNSTSASLLMVMCFCSVSDRHTRLCSAWWN